MKTKSKSCEYVSYIHEVTNGEYHSFCQLKDINGNNVGSMHNILSIGFCDKTFYGRNEIISYQYINGKPSGIIIKTMNNYLDFWWI